MDLTEAVRYKSLASACAQLLATAMLAIGGSLFINESPITEAAKAAVVNDIKPSDIKEYIKSYLKLDTYL